jgi:hypothetical protein
MSEDDFAKDLASKMEALFMQAAMGGPPTKQRQTAMRYRWGRFETVELDDAGNVIEPPTRCFKCGVVLCAEHAAMIS